ncbi:ATP-binding protein [Aquabacterium sp. CECT 9606]|uniref:sensor histidine kinase n=1 Tax=Aquabacterium sp. CECT 9606 TaxID=2845822 RepID=UPI001E36DD1E|nr:ATP-binding protein [Aquabacterium sp. CECT 9606]CAH0351000.1 Sensor histidine kinase GlrK [Aquabacterium sp. CECT 9606]
MLTFYRASFRQLLLAAFLLIAGLLAAASLGGLFTLERLMVQSRAAAERAVQLSAGTQHLAERSVAMERAARQYLVLDDPVLLRRFEDATKDANRVLEELQAQQLPPALVARWRGQLTVITDQFKGPKATGHLRELALAQQFRELDLTNAAIAEQVRKDSEQRNHRLQDELEAGRAALARQVLGAIALAVVMALGFGVWLTRPLKRLERAIVGLGENRLDVPVNIQGPSDLRSLGQRLEWLRLRLRELDDDKSRFLRHVSHELKTPLAALREGVALLEDGVAGELSADQREIAQILGHNTAALQSQIEDLLRFNAAAFDARRLSRRKTDLAELIQTLVDAQRLQWQARQLHINVAGGPLHVEVDPEKLGTALGNLLSNAIRFSPPGATIRFSLTRLPGLARIDIVDQGAGVAESDSARVFEPFYRGERQPEGAVRGTGIGLSIVREYVEAHGGRVDLLPEGPGAHFRIELPNAVM